HLQEPAAGMEILAVRAQVLGQVIDSSGQERDLDFRRAGILLVGFVFVDDLWFNDCGGHGLVVWFTTVGGLLGLVTPAGPTGNRAKPASPFQSGGMPDQSWWDPATDGIPLTQ